MSDLTQNFHYKSLEQALYKLSEVFRREFLNELVHHAMDKVFKDSYKNNVVVEHEDDPSDEENPTPEPVKRPRGRPRKN